MNREDIKKYRNIDKEVFSTSEVLKDSFVNVLKLVKSKEYVLVSNLRQKQTLVVQDIDKFIEVKTMEIKRVGVVAKTSAELILLAKQFIKDNIFFLMRFESKNITFPKIETILGEPGLTKKGFDVEITRQLQEAWKYVLRSPKPFDPDEMIKLQGIIAKNQALEWGVIRKGNVTISGTNYIPPIPKLKDITLLFDDFHKTKDKRNGAAKLLIKLIKMQPFWDGNKRTSFLTVNRLLIENEVGILSVDNLDFEKFNILLNDYYNDKNENELIRFIEGNIFNTTKRTYTKN